MKSKKSEIFLSVVAGVVLFFLLMTTLYIPAVIFALVLLLWHRAYEVIICSIFFDLAFVTGGSKFFLFDGVWTFVAILVLVIFDIFRKNLF